jgi:hypothetical protein
MKGPVLFFFGRPTCPAASRRRGEFKKPHSPQNCSVTLECGQVGDIIIFVGLGSSFPDCPQPRLVARQSRWHMQPRRRLCCL